MHFLVGRDIITAIESRVGKFRLKTAFFEYFYEGSACTKPSNTQKNKGVCLYIVNTPKSLHFDLVWPILVTKNIGKELDS